MSDDEIFNSQFTDDNFERIYQDLEQFWSGTLQDFMGSKEYKNPSRELFLAMLSAACLCKVREGYDKFSSHEEKQTVVRILEVLEGIAKGRIVDIKVLRSTIPPKPRVDVRADGNVMHLISAKWAQKPIEKQRLMWRLIRSNHKSRKLAREIKILEYERDVLKNNKNETNE